MLQHQPVQQKADVITRAIKAGRCDINFANFTFTWFPGFRLRKVSKQQQMCVIYFTFLS